MGTIATRRLNIFSELNMKWFVVILIFAVLLAGGAFFVGTRLNLPMTFSGGQPSEQQASAAPSEPVQPEAATADANEETSPPQSGETPAGVSESTLLANISRPELMIRINNLGTSDARAHHELGRRMMDTPGDEIAELTNEMLLYRGPGLTGEQGIHPLLRTALIRWAEVDAVAAFRRTTQPDVPAEISAMASGTVLRLLSASSPDQAWSLSKEIEEIDHRNLVQKQLLVQLGASDPSFGQNVVANDEQLSQEAVDVFFSSWAKSSPLDAVEGASLVNESRRDPTTISVINSIAMTDPEEALAQIQNLPQDLEQKALASVIGIIAEFSLEDAKDLFLRLENGTPRTIGLRSLTEHWAMEEPAAAASFIDRLDDPIAKESVMPTLLDLWSNRDPMGAARYAFSQTVTSAITGGILKIAERLTDDDLESTLAWANNLNENQASRLFVQQLYDRIALNDPGKAAATAKRIPPSFDSQMVYGTIARRWALQDPTGAATWVETIPDELGKRRAHYEVALQWSRTAPSQAAEWINTLPGSVYRNRGMIGISYAIQDVDPAAALQWASAVDGESEFRLAQVTRIIQDWRSTEPAAADAWIAASDWLTIEERDTLEEQAVSAAAKENGEIPIGETEAQQAAE